MLTLHFSRTLFHTSDIFRSLLIILREILNFYNGVYLCLMALAVLILCMSARY